MKRLGRGVVLGLSLALCACNGWPRAPKLAKAKHKPEKYVTYQPVPAQPVDTFTFEGRRWMVVPAVSELHGADLQQVGNAGGFAVYSAKGDDSPHGVLYAAADGGKWRAVQPIE